MQKALFIHNPRAGTGPKTLGKILETTLSRDGFSFDIKETERPGHATDIVREHLDDYAKFYAIGGDGTVNEVGKALVNTDKELGIIPTGPGNGLAIELGLKKWDKKSPLSIHNASAKRIDTFSVNEHTCLNVAGLGFDAQVAHKFLKLRTRGFFSYVASTVNVLFKYKPLSVKMKLADSTMSLKVFSVSFANSRQFGNNAFIAPEAILDDGLIDIAVIRPFPLYMAPIMAIRLFNKNLHKSPYYSMMRAKEVEIIHSDSAQWHIDGEAVLINTPVRIINNAKSLRVMVQ